MTGAEAGGGTVPSATGPSATVVVDAMGALCPLPIIQLARRIREIEVGDLVELWADDPAAGPDVRAWCRMRDQQFVGVRPTPAGDGSIYLVRRSR